MNKINFLIFYIKKEEEEEEEREREGGFALPNGEKILDG
jgi:hypothetical protein